MHIYRRQVHYYETDQMRVVHHSNYIRWMEEARIDLLTQLGWPYSRMEDAGVVCPVVSVEGKYKRSTKFGDTVSVCVHVAPFNGIRLKMTYEVLDGEGVLLFTGSSENCFTDGEGRVLNMKKAYPELWLAICGEVEA